MKIKELTDIVNTVSDSFAKLTKANKLVIKESDVVDRLKNPCPHNESTLFKKAATIDEKIRIKVILAVIGYSKPLL